MKDGWVKIWRKSIDSQVFQDAELWKMWSWCLMKATHKRLWMPVRTGRGGSQVELEPGQFIFGRFEAAKELKMKPSSVRYRMQKLKDIGNLDIKVDTHFSVVSIINWEIYQQSDNGIEQASEQPTDNQLTGNGQATDTYKNVKNDKKEKKYTPTALFVKFYADLFESHFGTKPLIEQPKDNAIVKKLLKEIPLEDLKELLQRFFVSEDTWVQDKGYTIGIFKSQINKLKIGTPKQTIPKYLHGLKEVYDDIEGEKDSKEAVPLLDDQISNGIQGERKQGII